MPQTDFLNKNQHRRYPLQDNGGTFIGGVGLPLSAFVDAGFLLGPAISFDSAVNTVELTRVWRDGVSGIVYFEFQTNPSCGYMWVFTREPAAPGFYTENVDAVPIGTPPPYGLGSETTPPSPYGEAYLITGDLQELLDILPAGTTLNASAGSFVVENSCIQVTENTFLQTVTLANDVRPELICQPWLETATVLAARALVEHTVEDRLVIDNIPGFYLFDDASTAADDGLNVIKPDDIASIDPGRWVLYPSNAAFPIGTVYTSGTLQFMPGYNCQIEVISSDNLLEFSASAGSGAGALCNEVPGYTTLIGCRCRDAIRTINGVSPVNGNINILGQMGVLVDNTPAENKIQYTLQASQANVCDIPPNTWDPCYR